MKVAKAKRLGESSLTLTKEIKIKNIDKPQIGQVWVAFPEQKTEPGVVFCVIDVYVDAALIVILHNERQLHTRIEPWVVLHFFHELKLIAAIERTLAVSFEAFKPDCCLGKISAEQVNCIIQAYKEFEDILFANAELDNLEGNGRKDLVTDELINKAFKAVLFLPHSKSLEDVVNLHTKLQSVVQRHHEKLFFG